MAKTKKTNKKTKPSSKKKTKPPKKPSFFRVLFKWLFVLGIWGGLALSALIIWYAADLPKIMATPQFEQRHSVTLLAADDKTLITRYGDVKGDTRDVSTLPPYLLYAVIAIEDRRFYQHFGLDPLGLGRAIFANLKAGHTVQGGSTITQQLAKNLFLSPDRTLKRKIQEALLALWLERVLTKDEILSAYLNRVYLGSGNYGVEAAAQNYFGKEARALSLYESALIAGLLKAPSRYSPFNSPDKADRRARVVLSAMQDAGYITAQQEKQAAAGKSPVTRIAAPKTANLHNHRYFGDDVLARLKDLIGDEHTENLTIYTTLDPTLQKAAQQALEETLARAGTDKHVTQGAIIVLDYDGAIRAMVGGRNYNQSQFNRATQARRPPGSAFKPFVYAAALEQGTRAHDKILDAPLTDGNYHPENFNNEYDGLVTLDYALSHSLNTASVRLMQETGGPGKTISLARKSGITAPLNRDLSLALGSSGVPLLDMVQAYGIFARQGYKITPYAITRIDGQNGLLLYQRGTPPRDKSVINKSTAREMTAMLRHVVSEGTGKRAALPRGQMTAGKTGTSQDYRDAWFIGYSDRFIAGVWLGNDDNSPMNNVTGGALPADIWRTTMVAAHDTALPATEKGGPNIPPSENHNSGFSNLLKRLLND